MAGQISKRTIEEVRFRSDIVEVIGSYLTLRRSGSTYKALCPFHREKTPSFVVHPQRQIFHCFGCGRGGDVFTFIQTQEGLDFMGALELLARRAGIPLERETMEGRASRTERELLWQLHEEIAAFYQRCLHMLREAATARAYLEARRLGSEALETFRIGYAPERWDAALEWGKKHGYGADQLERAGLVIRHEEEGRNIRFYDRFRHRIMFPIRDIQGRVVGFSARTLEAEGGGAKYINSPETPIFQKNRILYALDLARTSLAKADSREAIVCEGQIDVIRCHLCGFGTAVAAQGTAFSEEHARLLRRFADGAVLVFDADRAGQDAAIRTASVLLEAGLAVRVARLPPGEDPDSFLLRQGAAAFQEILDRAQPAVAFQIDVLSEREQPDREAGFLRIARSVLDTILRSPDRVQQARLIQIAAERLKLPVTALEAERRRRGERRSVATTDGPSEKHRAIPPRPPCEEVVLCEHLAQAFGNAEVIELLRRYLPPDRLTDVHCRQFVEAVLAASESGADLMAAIREKAGEGEELPAFAARLLAAPIKIRSAEGVVTQAVQDLILRLWQRALRGERDRLAAIDSPESERRRAELTCHLNRLRTWQDGASIIEAEMAE